MMIFLYGPDTYRSRQKLNEIIEHYKKIHKSGLNFSVIDFKSLELSDFKKIIESCSMFKEKKLIVLKNLFFSENTTGQFLDYLEKNNFFSSQEEIIILYEENLAPKEFKENSKLLFAQLKKYAKCQEFELLGGWKLKNWLKKELGLSGFQITPPALEKLTLYVGNDLWRMSNEIKKLISYKYQGEFGANNAIFRIGEKDIELLVKPEINTDIFKTIDAVAVKNKKLAIKLIREHLENGENEKYILSMILWQFRNLVRVKSYESKCKFNVNYANIQIVNKLSKELKIRPYVVEKSLRQAKRFTMAELKKIYQKLLEVDYNIKTGKMEARIALDLFIAEI